MRLGEQGRHWLLGALRELAAGRSNRFEDLLWLGFGDDWTRLRDHLIKEGDVRYDPAGVKEPVITPLGEALLERLAASVEGRGGSGPGAGSQAAARAAHTTRPSAGVMSPA